MQDGVLLRQPHQRLVHRRHSHSARQRRLALLCCAVVFLNSGEQRSRCRRSRPRRSRSRRPSRSCSTSSGSAAAPSPTCRSSPSPSNSRACASTELTLGCSVMADTLCHLQSEDDQCARAAAAVVVLPARADGRCRFHQQLESHGQRGLLVPRRSCCDSSIPL